MLVVKPGLAVGHDVSPCHCVYNVEESANAEICIRMARKHLNAKFDDLYSLLNQ